MLQQLSRTPALVLTGLIMVGAYIAIEIMRGGTGGLLLDLQMTENAARSVLEELKTLPNAVGVHVYISAGADMVFPLAYGLFGAGLTTRLSGRSSFWLTLPIGLAALLDVAENTVQILALTGTPDALAWKSVLTPAKFALAGAAILLALVLAVLRIRRGHSTSAL